MEDAFEPQQALDAIGQGTVFMAVPPIYYRLLEEPRFREAAQTWTGVRLFTCGSAPIRPEVLPELESILGRPVINRYGMTEAYVITSLPLDGPVAGRLGRPAAGGRSSCRCYGTTASPPPKARWDRSFIRGPNLFREYWHKPEATRGGLRQRLVRHGRSGHARCRADF